MAKLPILMSMACVILMAGCGSRTAPLRVDAGHPADPRAPEAPVAPRLRLAPDA